MYRAILLFVCASALGAQPGAVSPFDALAQAYWKAHSDGRFRDAAAARDDARHLLDRVAVEQPRFAWWLQTVAQLYQGAGRDAEARDIVQQSLDRAGRLAPSHRTRAELLIMLADLWEQDRNLLKSVACREQAAAILEAQPPGAANQYSNRPDLQTVYQRLIDTYRRLGRPEDVGRVRERILNHSPDRDSTLASIYDQDGRNEEAAAIYKRLSEQATAGSWQRVQALQSLSYAYERQARYADAIATFQEAIATVETSALPEMRGQAIWMRQNLAGLYERAGQTDTSDAIYTRLLAETGNSQDGAGWSVLLSYAHYLARTKRGEQADNLLNDYRASHTDLQPWDAYYRLRAFAAVARESGRPDRAAEYQRAAEASLPAMQPPGRVSISADLELAEAAADRNDGDTALSLTLRAIDKAPAAVDRDVVFWRGPSIACRLASGNAPEQAEQLFQRLFPLAESRSDDTLTPLLRVEQSYVEFLAQQQHRGEMLAAIGRYRGTLFTARGEDTGWKDQILKMMIEAADYRGSIAITTARDLLALEESLNGDTSEPYLVALETLAGILEASGESAIPLRRQADAIRERMRLR